MATSLHGKSSCVRLPLSVFWKISTRAQTGKTRHMEMFPRPGQLVERVPATQFGLTFEQANENGRARAADLWLSSGELNVHAEGERRATWSNLLLVKQATVHQKKPHMFSLVQFPNLDLCFATFFKKSKALPATKTTSNRAHVNPSSRRIRPSSCSLRPASEGGCSSKWTSDFGD